MSSWPLAPDLSSKTSMPSAVVTAMRYEAVMNGKDDDDVQVIFTPKDIDNGRIYAKLTSTPIVGSCRDSVVSEQRTGEWACMQT